MTTSAMDESCLYGSEMMFDGMMSSAADHDRYDILSSALDVSTLDATSTTPAEVLLNSRTRTTLTTTTTATTMSTCTSSSTTTTTTTRAAQHCIKISNVPSLDGPPRMVRLGSSDSSSSTSSSASCSSSSSAASSAESSPKRSIFKTYWEKTTDGASPPFRDLTGEEATKACRDLIAALALQGADEVPAASSASPTSSSTESRRHMESAASPPVQQAPPSSPPSSATKRSIFGDRAMHTARVSSYPELPSIAATMLPVRKASSTEALVQVRRKSCLRSVQSYSSPSASKNRKTATTATTTMRMKKSASTTTPSPEGGGRATSSQVQFNPEVQVYEFQKSIYERMMLHVELSSRDWSKLFA